MHLFGRVPIRIDTEHRNCTLSKMRKYSPTFIILFTLWLFGLSVLSSGCATSSSASHSATAQHSAGDPLEGVNRKVLNSNLKVDRVTLRPVAKTYARLPQPVRNGVGNFFSNLWMPKTVLNDLLQGKFIHAGRDTGRFVINTILGAAGLMDVAHALGLPAHQEDFGQTLAVWGVPAGPYLVLPFLGPRNLRDSVDLFSPFSRTDAISALSYPESWYATGIRLVDTRAGLLGAVKLLELQPNKYLFLREEYRRQRRQLIYDGNPPSEPNAPSEDQLLDELFE